MSLMDRMTPQQRAVMDLAVKHYSTAESAKILGLSEKTVSVHRYGASKACGMDAGELMKALFSEYMKEAEDVAAKPAAWPPVVPVFLNEAARPAAHGE